MLCPPPPGARAHTGGGGLNRGVPNVDRQRFTVAGRTSPGGPARQTTGRLFPLPVGPGRTAVLRYMACAATLTYVQALACALPPLQCLHIKMRSEQ